MINSAEKCRKILLQTAKKFCYKMQKTLDQKKIVCYSKNTEGVTPIAHTKYKYDITDLNLT